MNGRRHYTLEQINLIRAHFGVLPYRADNEEPITLAVQNFKGGVGKTTSAVHVAHYFSLAGYRVLFVDADPQASATSLFGINPDTDIDGDTDTLRPFLDGEVQSMADIVRGTYWPQLDLIPANLDLYNIEYTMAMNLQNNPLALDRLRRGLESIRWAYDIVIIDAPPALGMIPLSVLRAANAILVPVRPAAIDFASTAHFFQMLKESLESLKDHNLGASYKFLKILINSMDDTKSMHTSIAQMMEGAYGHTLLRTAMKDSAEIDNAGGRLMSVYELPKPITRSANHRCKAYLDQMCEEVQTAVRKTWPSHHESLRREGKL